KIRQLKLLKLASIYELVNLSKDKFEKILDGAIDSINIEKESQKIEDKINIYNLEDKTIKEVLEYLSTETQSVDLKVMTNNMLDKLIKNQVGKYLAKKQRE